MKTQLELNFKEIDENLSSANNCNTKTTTPSNGKELDKSEREAAYSVVLLLFLSLLFFC